MAKRYRNTKKYKKSIKNKTRSYRTKSFKLKKINSIKRRIKIKNLGKFKKSKLTRKLRNKIGRIQYGCSKNQTGGKGALISWSPINLSDTLTETYSTLHGNNSNISSLTDHP